MSVHRHPAALQDDNNYADIKPTNPGQADFEAGETSSMDSDERYLVRP